MFVSSHLMNEMAVIADHLVVIGRGRLIADCPTAEFIARSSHRTVRVVAPEWTHLERVIRAEGGQVATGQMATLPSADWRRRASASWLRPMGWCCTS